MSQVIKQLNVIINFQQTIEMNGSDFVGEMQI